jgi:nucleotide-binding universal stress UspA family protein
MTGVRTVILVANRTVGGAALAELVRARTFEGSCVVHLVVPIASPAPAAVAVGEGAANMSPTATFEVRDERQVADERLAFGLDWLATIGVEATGELCGGCDTASAVAEIVRAVGADEVIVSTLPTTISRWLRQDLPARVAKKVDVPVVVVTSPTS